MFILSIHLRTREWSVRMSHTFIYKSKQILHSTFLKSLGTLYPNEKLSKFMALSLVENKGLHYCIYLWCYMILLSLDSTSSSVCDISENQLSFINWAKNCGLWLESFPLAPWLSSFWISLIVQIEHWPFIMLNPFISRNTVLLILTSSIILCELRCLGCHSDLITHYDHCVYLSKISVLSNIVPVILIGYHSIAIRQVGFIIVSPILASNNRWSWVWTFQ